MRRLVWPDMWSRGVIFSSTGDQHSSHRDVDRLGHFNVFHFIVCYSDPAVLFDVVMVSPLMGLKGSDFYVSPPKLCFFFIRLSWGLGGTE